MSFSNESTIYGPVKSWRFGQSLGVDPIFQTSICSFNCTYCQLGQIQKITPNRGTYVPTRKVIEDFQKFTAKNIPIDVITFSGNGEPTLAKNLGNICRELKKITPIPLYILTNATTLHDPEVCEDLALFDKVILKLDAGDPVNYKKVNRPHHSLSFEKLFEGIVKYRKSTNQDIEIQTMLLPTNKKGVEDLISHLQMINPSFVQINTPKRPYPSGSYRENRGNHKEEFSYPVSYLKTLPTEELSAIAQKMVKETTLKVIFRRT